MDTTLSLTNLVGDCLSSRSSIDARARHGIEETFDDSVDLPADLKTCLPGIRQRFARLLSDLADYGTRGDYVFDMTREEIAERKRLETLARRRTKPATDDRASKAKTRSRTFGECLSALVGGFYSGTVEAWTITWLAREMGVNLDWLFFGIGPMRAQWKDRVGMLKMAGGTKSHYDKDTGQIIFEDNLSLQEKQSLSLWNYTDWQWLFNLRAIIKTSYRAPTLPLIARLVAGWRVPQQLPQMPSLSEWLDSLRLWCVKTFLDQKTAFPEDRPWMKGVVESFIANRNLGVLLLGRGLYTNSPGLSSKNEPNAIVLRLAWLVRMVIEQRGAEGFFDYLDMVNQEAHARGFDGLLEIFGVQGWSQSNRPTRKAQLKKEVSADDPDTGEYLDKAISWGIPKEVQLPPLELLALVRNGDIEMDEDKVVFWQCRKAQAKD